jgi:ADP-ribose pyrophosphatase YjhB (NUDIX family)
MIRVVCSAIIRKDNTFLMVKETKPSAAGKWGIPGGKLEEDESIVDGVRREVNEETGFTVKQSCLIGIINKPRTHEGHTVVKFIFDCTISDRTTAKPEHEHAFLSLDEIRALDKKDLIRGKEILGLLEDHANLVKQKTPFLQII